MPADQFHQAIRIPTSRWAPDLAGALEELKERLLRENLLAASDAALLPRLRRAAAEAASLAWTTPYPLLVLPVLLGEKLAEASRQAQRQREIRERSRSLLGPAA